MTLELDQSDARAGKGQDAGDQSGSTPVGHLVINFFNVVIILPLVWVLLMSVKSLPDAMQGNFWPKRFDFTHYAYVFQRIATLPVNLFNSVYVTAATVLITTAIAVLAGYALVHIRPRGAGVVLAMLFVSLYFPVRVVSLISILVMRSMFQLVPHEIIESAKIDGAGHLRTLWEVGLPMVRNGLVVIFIVNFVAAWGEYLLGVTLIDDEAKRTMPVVLAAAQGGQGQWAWPNLAAVYVIVVTPGIIAFTFAQKLFFKGLLEGALKG